MRTGCDADYGNEDLWKRGNLRRRCKNVKVEKEFKMYQMRLRISSLGVFFVLHTSVTFGHIFLLIMFSRYNYIVEDIAVHSAGAILALLVLSVNFYDDFVRKHSSVMYVTSVIAVFILVLADIVIITYHVHHDDWALNPFYGTYVLYMSYLYMPIPNIKGPLLLGSAASLVYVYCHFLFFSSLDGDSDTEDVSAVFHLLVAILHYFCFNTMGTFYRFMNDIIVRSSFLDRHQFVMEEIRLYAARRQEKQLLHSILPPQIAQPFQQEIRNLVELTYKGKVSSVREIKNIIAIQKHPDVTILYADMVNYTHMTTTLTVKMLVTLLHDLYGRFDLASLHYKVQRIKFLGDCYYCVSGLNQPTPIHANSCLDLAIYMIDQIRNVRMKWAVDIDMRIGVHSGTILAGVIGTTKLQFDIWGEDVVIANKLEETGLAGHIHLSDRTLGLVIGDAYSFMPGTDKARDNAFLRQLNIRTYLINVEESAIEALKDFGLNELASQSSLTLVRATQKEHLNSVDERLRHEFQQMPVGAIRIQPILFRRKEKQENQHSISSLIHFLFLHFNDPRYEYNYLREPDYMLKYSILLAWFVGSGLICVELTVARNESLIYFSNYVCLAVMLFLSLPLLILWYRTTHTWWNHYKNIQNIHYSKISCFIFSVSEFMQTNLLTRITLYLSILLCYFIVIVFILRHCDRDQLRLYLIDNMLFQYEENYNICFQPWVLTHIVCLIIGMSIIFTRIPWMLKIVISFLEAFIYIFILYQYEDIISQGRTTNPYYPAIYAHGYILAYSLATLILVERQAEFNKKVNFNWRRQLRRKQREAIVTNKSIKILLRNILPAHVVSLYLNSLARRELYYEEYKMVAVMFASLNKFNIDLTNLRVLNEIITQFDRTLSTYKDDFMVEKIKIVGTTYMAACGLDPRYSKRTFEPTEFDDHFSPEGKKLTKTVSAIRLSYEEENNRNEEVVVVMTMFAMALLKTLKMCKDAYGDISTYSEVYSGDMRVGIACGEVMAGVVGCSQVSYDIWGNTVNMASRMDSTGVGGRIQVTEESALVLRKYGVECEYKGMTFVKGRGLLPTYFVNKDHEKNLRSTLLIFVRDHEDYSPEPEPNNEEELEFENRPSYSIPEEYEDDEEEEQNKQV